VSANYGHIVFQIEVGEFIKTKGVRPQCKARVGWSHWKGSSPASRVVPEWQGCSLSLGNHGRKDYECGAHVKHAEMIIPLRVGCWNTFQSSHMWRQAYRWNG